jgi:hypothetical protein
MQSYRAEGYGRMSLLLFLTHYIRYHNIKTADDLRVVLLRQLQPPQGRGRIPHSGRGFVKLVPSQTTT